MWRTGSVGESGPFIGLEYGYTIELAKRIAATREGHARAFELKAEMMAELPEEPDVLSFTVDEAVDGMSWYSWGRAQTLAWLCRTIDARLAAFGITPSASSTLAAAAMDGALKPEVAALIQKLREL